MFSHHGSLTLTMTAESASVTAPKKAAITLAARKLSKLLATDDQMAQPKTTAVHSRNTGLRPKYTAMGTQKRFFHSTMSVSTFSQRYSPGL